MSHDGVSTIAQIKLQQTPETLTKVHIKIDKRFLQVSSSSFWELSGTYLFTHDLFTQHYMALVPVS